MRGSEKKLERGGHCTRHSILSRKGDRMSGATQTDGGEERPPSSRAESRPGAHAESAPSPPALPLALWAIVAASLHDVNDLWALTGASKCVHEAGMGVHGALQGN